MSGLVPGMAACGRDGFPLHQACVAVCMDMCVHCGVLCASPQGLGCTCGCPDGVGFLMVCVALGICTFFWSSAYVFASGCV